MRAVSAGGANAGAEVVAAPRSPSFRAHFEDHFTPGVPVAISGASSGHGHGDPVDVETALHSHLIYLWEITVNDRVHTYFPISTDTSQRRTEVKTSVASCRFLIC